MLKKIIQFLIGINKHYTQDGQAFILAVIVLTVILLNTLLTMNGSVAFFQNSRYSLESQQALNLAEAGIDKAVATINANAGDYTGETETNLGSGTYKVTVISQASGNKTIESTGYIPNSTSPKTKKTVRIQIAIGTGASFSYALQTGFGGLKMKQNARVEGSVYSNGDIIMEENSSITGDVYVAGGVAPNPDQQNECQEPDCQEYIFGKIVNGNKQYDIAQSFKPSSTTSISKLSLNLKKVNNPSDIIVRILPDNNGKPAKANALASGTLYSSLVTTNFSFTDIALTTNPVLTQDTTYWIVVDTSGNETNYWVWRRASLGGYSNGFAMWSDDWNPNGNKNPTWSSVNLSGDLDFKTYMGGVATKITGANGVSIGGDVHANTINNTQIAKAAYYQIINQVNALSYYPGSADPPIQLLPLSDSKINEWTTIAAQNGVFNTDITTCPSSLQSGKYTGSITLPGGCHVIVDSPVWITGNLSLSNNDTLELNPEYGASSGVIVVKNFINMDNNNLVKGTASPGSFLVLLSEFSSKDDPLARDAITLTNNANSAVLYTNSGSIKVSNNNNLTSVTAWKLILENNVLVQYQQGLAGLFFASGPQGAFSVIKGTYQIK